MRFKFRTVSRDSAKTPLQSIAIFLLLRDSKNVSLASVPKDGPAKGEAKRKIVDERLQRARPIPREVCMTPRPFTAMPVSAIVTLQAKAQWRTFELAPVQNNLSG